MKRRSNRRSIQRNILWLIVTCIAVVANGQEITVDFSQSAYPPLVNKWGYNSFWNQPGVPENNEVNTAGDYNMQAAAGLVELTQQEEGEFVPRIFTRPGPELSVTLQEDYQQLRQTLKSNRMLQFTQFCGTPMEMFEDPKYQQPAADTYPNLFPNMLYDYYLQNPITTSNNEYKYRWSSTFGGGGNSYPLPDHAGMDEYAEAWAEYAEQMFTEDKQAQVFAFWQEVTHTIVSKEGVEYDGDPSGQITNMSNFLDFYTRVGPKIKARNPDFMLAGFQLNDANVSKLKTTLENGAQGTWGEWILEELLRRENANGTRYPLDFFAIQTFTDSVTQEIFERMRSGLVNDRYNKTPLMFNRYKHRLADGTKDNNSIFNTSAGISDMLDNIEILYNAPELSYVLWSNWKAAVNKGWMALDIMDITGQMKVHRKGATVTGGLEGQVKVLASGNNTGITIILWNTTSGSRQFVLNLQNLPVELRQNSTLELFSMENNSRMFLENSFTVSGDTFSESINLAGYGVKFVRIAGQEEEQVLADATYAKHEVWVDRDNSNPTQVPGGAGHYDLQTGTLTVGTNAAGEDVAGLAGVIYRDLPPGDYTLKARLNSYSLPTANRNTKICLRVDYLDRESTLKTVYYYASGYGASGQFTNIDWRPKKDLVKIESDFSTGVVDLDISGNAPSGWLGADNGARRVMVSLLMRNALPGSVISATLSDNQVVPCTIPGEVTLAKNDATCGQNDGTITFSFNDDPARSSISLSIDGGNTYTTVADTTSTYVFNNLPKGTYKCAALWDDSECFTEFGEIMINCTGGIAGNIPGLVEAEDYTDQSGIKTEPSSEGGLNVGGIATGEWIDYRVIVAEPGEYQVDFRVAAKNNDISFDLPRGDTVLASISSPATGDFQVWKTVSDTISLQAGEQTLRVLATGSKWNIDWLEFTKLAKVYDIHVVYKDGDSDSTNNQVKPHLRLNNLENVDMAYSDLVLRYWFTSEDHDALQFHVDWAQIGAHHVNGKFVMLDSAREGANYYLQVSFDSTAGALTALANSGDIQLRFNKEDWTNFDESDDYSHSGFSDFTQTDHITLYHSGDLIWGEEPPVSSEQGFTIKVLHKRGSDDGNNDNQIKPYLEVVNEGNQPMEFADLTLRYWFTKDGDEDTNLNFWTDWVEIGPGKISGQFVSLSPGEYNGADQYVEVSFEPSLGSLYAFSSTGEIQTRLAKSNWAAFDESDDFSFAGTRVFMPNEQISAYYRGELIWGKDPTKSVATSSTKKKPGGIPVNDGPGIISLYPNPVKDVVHLANVEADTDLHLTRMDGQVVMKKHNTNALNVTQLPPGYYVLRIETIAGKVSFMRFIIQR